MEKTIQKFLTSAIGKPVWNVRIRLGSMLAFEIGDEVEEGRGEFHFSFDKCHWWLQEGKENSVTDIIHSESLKELLESKVKVLEGKSLVSVQINEELSSAIFDFTDNYFLKVAPYGSTSILDQWKVFTPNKVLKVFSNSKVEIETVN